MNQHPEEAASDVRAVWQRPGWYLIRGALAPEAQAEADEQAYVHKGEQVVDALEEVKRTGNALVLLCPSPARSEHAGLLWGGVYQRTAGRLCCQRQSRISGGVVDVYR